MKKNDGEKIQGGDNWHESTYNLFHKYFVESIKHEICRAHNAKNSAIKRAEHSDVKGC